MRIWKLPLALVMLLGFAALVPADDDRDRDDDKPVKTGYVIVTPSSGGASPVASVIFGHSEGNTTTEAGVLATNLTNSANLFISVSGRFNKNIGVALTNPNNRTARVTLSLTDKMGAAVGASQVVSVEAYHQTSRFVTELFGDSIPKSFTGMLLISSDAPVALTGLRIRGENMTTIPLADLSTTNFPVPLRNSVGGPGAIVLPMAAFGGGFSSAIILMNTTSSAISGRVDVFNPDGSPLSVKLNNQTASTFNYTIPAKGVFVLDSKGRGGENDDDREDR